MANVEAIYAGPLPRKSGHPFTSVNHIVPRARDDMPFTCCRGEAGRYKFKIMLALIAAYE